MLFFFLYKNMSSQVPNIINVNQVLFMCEKFLQDLQEPRHEKFFFRTYIDIKCLLFIFQIIYI